MSKSIAFAILLAAAIVSAQTRQLKIVVLEGENAVNIIQQKTAVRAVVEVRDQNNLPVQGASVTFAVTGKGGAAVAGSQSITVTTNAAGQASLSGMTPASSGGLQLSVNATYNGVSAATSITQTVVATAAVATATTAAATAAATGAAAGGGLSTGAIVGIVGGVAAVGGGVAVATGASGGQRDERDVPFVPTGNPNEQPNRPACTFSVSPTELLVPISGGSFPITVTVSPANCLGPEWSVDTNRSAGFVTANPVSGTGTGTFTLTLAPFTPTSTFPSRSGTIGVASTVIQIFQPTRF